MNKPLNESQASLLLRAARQAYALGLKDAAQASCHAILQSVPEQAGALHLLGVIALEDGQRRPAEVWLRRAAEAADTLPVYLLTYAELVLRHQDRRAALAVTRRALALDDGAPLGWFTLGDQLLDLQEYAESRACFERALALNPAQWQSHARLALLCVRSGNIADGIARFEEVRCRDPDNADVIANHAAILEVLGRLGEALTEIERAICLAPTRLEHHLRAAGIEMQLGRHLQSLARLDGPAARWADDIRSIVLRATLLTRLDRIDEAIALCRDALANVTESAELLRVLGFALSLEGECDAAIEVLERAIADRPGPALVDKALALSRAGRLEEARAACELALQCEPQSADAWYHRALISTYRRGDPAIDAMEAVLAGHGGFWERLLLHFAIGKAHADAGDQAAAFSHWERGNRMKRSITDYDPAITAREFAAIIARWPQAMDFADAAGAERSKGAQLSELPVFIVGMPRCGSSLLEQILASHPAVRGAGEQTGVRRVLLDHRGTESDRAAAAIARLRRHSPDALRVIDKDLQNFKLLDLIHRLLPRARIIHCRRDPVDTCFSNYTKLFIGDWPFAYDLRELGLYYREYQALMQHWQARLPAAVYMDLDYEALVSDPNNVIRRLLDFLDLPWSDACGRFFETPRSVTTASLAQVRQPLYTAAVGRSRAWSAYLEPLTEALGASCGA